MKTYKVIIDYTKSLADMIKAGKYDWSNGNINDQNFPIQGAGQHETKLVLVYLGRGAKTFEVLDHLNREGLEPAKVEHLLAFCTAYPGIIQKFPIIALGSVHIPDYSGGSRWYLGCENCPDSNRQIFLACDCSRHRWDGDDCDDERWLRYDQDDDDDPWNDERRHRLDYGWDDDDGWDNDDYSLEYGTCHFLAVSK